MRSKAELIEAYLLGELSDEERSAVEERMFPDDAFFDLIQFHEDALIDSYLRGELPGQRRTHFEEHFLASPRRRQRLEVARALESHFGQIARLDSRKSWWSRIKQAYRNDSPMLRLVYASCALTVAFAVLSIWSIVRLSQERDLAAKQQRSASQEIARLEQEAKRIGAPTKTEDRHPAASPGPLRAPVVSFVLLPGLLRAAHEKTLTIPLGSEAVRLMLESEYALPAGEYLVTIRTSQGAGVWETEMTLSRPSKPPFAVEASLPTPCAGHLYSHVGRARGNRSFRTST